MSFIKLHRTWCQDDMEDIWVNTDRICSMVVGSDGTGTEARMAGGVVDVEIFDESPEEIIQLIDGRN